MQTSKTIARDAALAAGIATALLALFFPRDLGASLPGPHPIWLAVLITAALHAHRGLALGGPIAAASMLAASAMLTGNPSALIRRAESTPDLFAMLACVLVAWVAAVHERKLSELQRKSATLEASQRETEGLVSELCSTTVATREHADRLETSLQYLRDVARRLEGGTAEAASQAALDLAMARIGARAGVVQTWNGRNLRTLFWCGIWSAESLAPPELHRDKTAYKAALTQRPVRIGDVEEATIEDSDLAAPIENNAGELLGVIALRGVPFPALASVALHELTVIAEWLSKALDARARQLDAENKTASGNL